MKGGKYTKTLAKIWVEGIIRIQDIRGNVLGRIHNLRRGWAMMIFRGGGHSFSLP